MIDVKNVGLFQIFRGEPTLGAEGEGRDSETDKLGARPVPVGVPCCYLFGISFTVTSLKCSMGAHTNLNTDTNLHKQPEKTH